MNIWFTSDTHFGHENIIKYCNRPFSNAKEMDEALIENWNRLVKKGDTIYHLGDFCFGDVQPYFEKLTGHKKFIMGSHDSEMDLSWTLGYLYILKTPFIKNDHHIRVTLCHYAMRSWDRSHYGSWHLFGHHHGTMEPYGLSFDVGVDTHNFKPWHIDEVAEKMKTLKPIVDYSKERK